MAHSNRDTALLNDVWHVIASSPTSSNFSISPNSPSLAPGRLSFPQNIFHAFILFLHPYSWNFVVNVHNLKIKNYKDFALLGLSHISHWIGNWAKTSTHHLVGTTMYSCRRLFVCYILLLQGNCDAGDLDRMEKICYDASELSQNWERSGYPHFITSNPL